MIMIGTVRKKDNVFVVTVIQQLNVKKKKCSTS
jgi:hypothetical protein